MVVTPLLGSFHAPFDGIALVGFSTPDVWVEYASVIIYKPSCQAFEQACLMLPWLDVGTQDELPGCWSYGNIALDMGIHVDHVGFERAALLLTVRSSDTHMITYSPALATT